MSDPNSTWGQARPPEGAPPVPPGYDLPEPGYTPPQPGPGQPQPGYTPPLPGSSEPPYQPPYQPPPGPVGPGSYAPPPGTPPYGPPPTETRSGPRIWPYLLGTLAVLMFGIGGCSYWVFTKARGPVDATNAFVAALDEGRFDDAYADLCASTQQDVSRQAFQLDNAAGTGITDYTFASVSASTGQLTKVMGTITIDGQPRTITYGLHQEGGEWRICSYLPLQ